MWDGDEDDDDLRLEVRFLWKLGAALALSAGLLCWFGFVAGCADQVTNVTIGAPTPTPTPSPTPPAFFPTSAPCDKNADCCALNCTDGKCK